MPIPANQRPQPPINPEADRYGAEALTRAAAATVQAIPGPRNVPYGPEPEQLLDLFLPRPSNRPAPVLLFLHGGGFTHGYKEWCAFMAPALTGRGIALASPDYRLLPHVSHPAPLHDCAAALAWLYRTAAMHGLAADRIFIGGHSAGAYYAAALAVQPGLLATHGLPADVIKGCFCISGTYTRRMVNPDTAPDHVPPGDLFTVAPDSPLALVDHARCPFDLVWGEHERERIGRTGRLMAAALQRVGVAVDSKVYGGADHFSVHLEAGAPDSDWMDRVAPRILGG